jgi:hypothetical protein
MVYPAKVTEIKRLSPHAQTTVKVVRSRHVTPLRRAPGPGATRR